MFGVYYLCNKESFTRGQPRYEIVDLTLDTRESYERKRAWVVNTVYGGTIEVRRNLRGSRPCPLTVKHLDAYFEEEKE